MLHRIDEQYYPKSGNQFTYWFSFTYLFLIFHCLSPPLYNQQSTHLPNLIFFLSVSGWLMAALFLQMFSSTMQKSHVHTHCQNVTFLWHWKTQVFWTDFCGTQGQNSLKPIKPGLCPEKQDEWDPNVWHIFNSCTPRRCQFTQFSLVPQYVSQRWWTKLAWYRWSMYVSTM
jgi:hypothetical protein